MLRKCSVKTEVCFKEGTEVTVQGHGGMELGQRACCLSSDYKYRSSHGITCPRFPDARHLVPGLHQLALPSMRFPDLVWQILHTNFLLPGSLSPSSYSGEYFLFFKIKLIYYLHPFSSNLLEPFHLPSSLPIRTSSLFLISSARPSS